MVISKLVKTKTNSKYLIGYSDKAIKPVVLRMSKMSGYGKTFEGKDGDKAKNNKLMSFCKDDKLSEKYKAIWTKIENLKNIEVNTLPVYDNRYVKPKIRAYGDKVYINFCDLNVLENDKESKFLQSFLLILYLYMTRKIICKYI